jgi:cytochrome P450
MLFNSPGRFFAVNEIKVLLARIITTYDIKTEEDKRVPSPRRTDTFHVVQNTNIFFRRRQI